MTQQLDVRTAQPARRHQLILGTYGALGAGESFVAVNDNDPEPLDHQLAAEDTGELVRQPAEEGPEVWRIRIARTAP